MRYRGVLGVVFKTPEMHIPPWYWFSVWLFSQRHRCGQAITTDSPGRMSLPGQVFEQDSVAGAKAPYRPVADTNLHLTP